jgi:hypothetical protein
MTKVITNLNNDIITAPDLDDGDFAVVVDCEDTDLINKIILRIDFEGDFNKSLLFRFDNKTYYDVWEGIYVRKINEIELKVIK